MNLAKTIKYECFHLNDFNAIFVIILHRFKIEWVCFFPKNVSFSRHVL